jgi:hypothetical protein
LISHTTLANIFLQGAELITGDADNVAAFYAQIPGAQDASSTVGEGYYSFVCNVTLSVVSFTLGGQDFPMTPQSLNAGTVSSGSTNSVGSIEGGGIGNTFWVLGDVTNYYTVFNIGSSHIYFATFT